MQFRQILICFVALLLITIILKTPVYEKWIDNYILKFTQDIYDQADNLNLEYRREYRYKESYTVSKQLKQKLASYEASLKNVLLLIPPQNYINRQGIPFLFPEPVVLYFFSNIKAALPTSKNVYKSNYGIRLAGQQLYIIKLSSKSGIDSMLNEYKGTIH